MARNSLPPGCRFHPTDVELVVYYLKRKILGKRLHLEAIAEVDIYKYAPWDLPAKSCLRTGDLKWFFFCPREKKYANGGRINRATEFGFWKTTGRDRSVNYDNDTVGKIKTLVFHRGKAPKGERTDWVMHEYRLEAKSLADRGVAQDAYVLCVVFQKEGPGPRNGAQYGAPFREEDWDDVDGVEFASSIFLSTPAPNQINPVASNSHVPDTQCIATSESSLSDAIPSAHTVLSPIPENNGTSDEVAPDDLDRMLDIFVLSSPNENDQNENLDNVHNENVEPFCNGVDFFNDLGDLGNLGRLDDGAFANADGNVYQIFPIDNGQFLELLDLEYPLSLPASAVETELIHADKLYANPNLFSSGQSLFTVNPCLSQSPIPPETPYDFDGQQVAYLKDNGSCGNEQQALLNNGNAT